MKVRYLACALALVWFAACGDKKGNGNGVPDASIVCGLFGTPCAAGGDCCSGVCDPQGGCTVNPTTCSQAGTTCSANTDCCSVSCVTGVCQASCTADNGSCTSNGQCCGGACNNGTCTPLNTGCKTDGNPCAANGDCCGAFCNAGGTCGNGSWCVVNGNACAHDAECCGGICNIAGGGTIGTCGQPSPGATDCSAGIDGSPCSTCGDCCSALCEVYQPTGVKVCQPAEGCRVDGDTCHASSDCCGAAGTGLPGDGNVVCLGDNGTVPNATDSIGICRNPTGCNPEGDTCHYLNYACGNSSKRNDCCAAPGNSGVCQLDPLGVPRCYGLGSSCVATSGYCATATDCCNAAPCVPDGQGHLVCGGGCVNTTGMCTSTGDCCSGLTCVFTPGQTYGTCGGMTGSGSGSNTCTGPLSGQACTAGGAACCPSGTPCNDNATGMACTSGSTACTCDGNVIF
jgi:hypothetical protein